jgi:uncharacterized membrane protein YukC
MREIARALIIILIIVLIWIGFSIYFSVSKKNIIPTTVSSSSLSNFNTSLYVNTFNTLKISQQYICINQNFTVKPCTNINKF